MYAILAKNLKQLFLQISKNLSVNFLKEVDLSHDNPLLLSLSLLFTKITLEATNIIHVLALQEGVS